MSKTNGQELDSGADFRDAHSSSRRSQRLPFSASLSTSNRQKQSAKYGLNPRRAGGRRQPTNNQQNETKREREQKPIDANQNRSKPIQSDRSQAKPSQPTPAKSNPTQPNPIKRKRTHVSIRSTSISSMVCWNLASGTRTRSSSNWLVLYCPSLQSTAQHSETIR